MSAIWVRGVPSHTVQQLNRQQVFQVRRAKEGARHATQRAISGAYQLLHSYGEDLQRIVGVFILYGRES